MNKATAKRAARRTTVEQAVTTPLHRRRKAAGPAGRFAPVRPKESWDRVATVLKELTDHIVLGDLETGGVLPPEGELARSFGVSRTVIREAMRSLRAQGLVEVSQGRQPRIKPPDSKATVTSLQLLLRRNRATLLHLLEVRRPLESEIAAIAAQRANDEHLRQLQRAVDDLAASPDLEGRIEADVRFHHILAEATGNPVFVLLLETLAEFLRESRQKTLAHSGVETALAGHRAILEGVRNHDSLEARAAMQKHLHLAARDLHEIADRKKTVHPS